MGIMRLRNLGDAFEAENRERIPFDQVSRVGTLSYEPIEGEPHADLLEEEVINVGGPDAYYTMDDKKAVTIYRRKESSL